MKLLGAIGIVFFLVTPLLASDTPKCQAPEGKAEAGTTIFKIYPEFPQTVVYFDTEHETPVTLKGRACHHESLEPIQSLGLRVVAFTRLDARRERVDFVTRQDFVDKIAVPVPEIPEFTVRTGRQGSFEISGLKVNTAYAIFPEVEDGVAIVLDTVDPPRKTAREATDH